VKPEVVLVVDVETAGGFGSPLVYDLGIVAVERRSGRVVAAHSLIVHDVFFGRADDMRTAYYACKVPTYYRGIRRGEHKVVRLWTAWRIVRDLMEKHNITRVYAYNAKFDWNALDNTLRKISHRRGVTFFPKNTQICDIWHMACQTFMKSRNYRKFCAEHGFVSEAGNYRTSAEVAYAYLTNNPTYTEPHTGLEDVHIERAILHKIIRRKQRVDERIVHNPWRIPQVAA